VESEGGQISVISNIFLLEKDLARCCRCLFTRACDNPFIDDSGIVGCFYKKGGVKEYPQAIE
jgi:hypothetical protein